MSTGSFEAEIGATPIEPPVASRGPHWLSGSIWNLLGTGLPFGFAVVCMPVLLHGLGAERYGLLILAWAVVGYFSIFDFGLSRAMTQLVARSYRISRDEAAPVVATGVMVLAALGSLGGLLLFLGAPFVGHLSRIPPALRTETVQSVKILGLGLPFVVISTGLRGALEGVFDFAWMNVIRVVSGIGTYVVPVAILAGSARVDLICIGLVVLRALTCTAYFVRCRSYFSLHSVREIADVSVAKRLLGYGGWITVSNLVSPMMAYLDRFVIAGTISVALAGYYSTSQEIVTKFQIIPGAVLSVLFPAISRSHDTSPERAGDIFYRGTQYVMYALLPLAAAVLLFAREGLGIWFGQEFATNAYVVAQILTIGSFLNCLAFNPFSFLQGIGRPDLTARIHLIELPLYLLLLFALIHRFGITGVALAWSARMALDLVILMIVTGAQSPVMRGFAERAAIRMIVPGALLAGLLFIHPIGARVAVLAAIAAGSAWALWSEWTSGHIALVEAGQ